MRYPDTCRSTRRLVLLCAWRAARDLSPARRPRVFCPRCGLPARVFLEPLTGAFGLSCPCDARLSLGALELLGEN